MKKICDEGVSASACASNDCTEAFLTGCNDNSAFIEMTETHPTLLSDCENNRNNEYADGSLVFGRDECLVFEHAVATDNECMNNCNGDADCYSSCPVQTCYIPCDASCNEYYTDVTFIDNCKMGCMTSCFEFKGSNHACSGMTTCGYFGTDPVCIAEGNCQFEAAHNDCYSAYQIGCKFMGINIHAQNSGASPQDDSNTENVAPVDCPSFCHIKCIALQVRFSKSKPQAE